MLCLCSGSNEVSPLHVTSFTVCNCKYIRLPCCFVNTHVGKKLTYRSYVTLPVRCLLYHATINDLFIPISYILSRSIYIMDNAVGIVTCYGLDSPGIECWCRYDFLHPSRQTLRPTQPPV